MNNTLTVLLSGLLLCGCCSQKQAISSIRANDVIYVLDTDGRLWRERGIGTERDLIDQNVKAFFVNHDRNIEVLGMDGNLWRERGTWRERDLIAYNVHDVQHVKPNPDYVLKHGDLRRKAARDSWELIDATAQAFQAKDRRFVYVLGDDGKLWCERGTWQDRSRMDKNVKSFQVIFNSTGLTPHGSPPPPHLGL
jgi:hypothetical protein